MKLSISIKYIREITKSLKIETSAFEIMAKKKDYTTINTKSIILFLEIFYIYI